MKKKIFAIALAALLFALSIAGASVAYFTDVESATNVFTAGDVDISLTYAGTEIGAEAYHDEDDLVVIPENTKVYPGQNFDIDATITNVGTEDAYVGAIITLTKMDGVIAETGDTVSTNVPVAVRKFLVGLVTTGYKVKIAEDANNDVITVYVIKDTAISTNATAVIFTDVKIPTDWDNAEMAAFSGFTLDVKAYAVQTGGFGDAEEAITTAFDAWDGYTVQNNG
jgi:predicted ribosomally synthesized peptide with SipW-like signal peptide